jgi:hypothetical protein
VPPCAQPPQEGDGVGATQQLGASSAPPGGAKRDALRRFAAVLQRDVAAEARLAGVLRAAGVADAAAQFQRARMTPALVMHARDEDLREVLRGGGGADAGADAGAAQQAIALVRRTAQDLCAATRRSASVSEGELWLLRALRSAGPADAAPAATGGALPSARRRLPVQPPRVPTRHSKPALACVCPKASLAYCRSSELSCWLSLCRRLPPHRPAARGYPPCAAAAPAAGSRCCADCVQTAARVTPVHSRCPPTDWRMPAAQGDAGCIVDREPCAHRLLSVAAGLCGVHVGALLCDALVLGTTKYGSLPALADVSLQLETLEHAAVYDVDAQGRLVVVCS